MRRDHTQDWHAWTVHRCEAARKRIIGAHLHLADITVDRAVPNIPARIDRSDLVAEAKFALVVALDRFDPGHGAEFATYAITYMRGACLNYLRQDDWASRGAREREKRLRAAGDALWMRGVRLSDETLADELGMPLAEFPDFLREATVPEPFSLDQVLPDTTDSHCEDEPLYLAGLLAAPDDTPAPLLEQAERDAVRDLLQHLPLMERRVMLAYYWEGLPFRLIALRIQRCESRTHQLHAAALGRLRQVAAQEGVSPCQ